MRGIIGAVEDNIVLLSYTFVWQVPEGEFLCPKCKVECASSASRLGSGDVSSRSVQANGPTRGGGGNNGHINSRDGESLAAEGVFVEGAEGISVKATDGSSVDLTQIAM